MGDARKRKVLPGIAKKPIGFTSMKMLVNARNAKKTESSNNLKQIVEVGIIQPTPVMPVQARNTMKMKMKMYPTTNLLYRLALSKYIGALLAFLAILIVISFLVVLYSCCPCECIREVFYGKQKKPRRLYRSFF